MSLQNSSGRMGQLSFGRQAVRLGVTLVSALFIASTVGISEAQAKRFGGGGFVGKPAAPMQRAAPPAKSAPQQTPPSQQASPAQQTPGNAAAAAPAGAAKAAPAAGASRWMAPLAGLAAGLGLAALASHLGLGEELMGLLMILLLVGLAFFILRMVLGRGRGATAGNDMQPSMARSGMMGSSSVAGNGGYGGSDNWNSRGSDPSTTSLTGAVLSPPSQASSDSAMSQAEIDQFLQVARAQFLSLQKLWDSGDLKAIEGFCTTQMAQEIAAQLATRGHAVNYTSVVELEVEWMGSQDGYDDAGRAVEEAYVGFRGLVREEADAVAEPFHEVWLLQKPKDGSDGWLLAGISQHA
jgi:predicted lipid-binding transport protein (Tim44 family)